MDTSRLLSLLFDFVATQSWRQAQAYVESHPELLSVPAAAAMNVLIMGARNNKDNQTANELSRHLHVLQRCNEIGIEAAFDEATIGTDPDAIRRPGDRSGATRLIRSIFEFVGATTWTDSRRMLAEHPELLTDDVDPMFEKLISDASGEQAQAGVDVLRRHQHLLKRCREIGVDAAFEEHERENAGERRIRELLFEFVTADSRAGALRIVEEHPELMSSEALNALGEILEEVQERDLPEMTETLRARLGLLEECVRVGLAAVAQAGSEDRSPEDVLEPLFELMEARSDAEVEEILDRHPELLGDEAERAVDGLIAKARSDRRDGIAVKLERFLDFLRSARETPGVLSADEPYRTEPLEEPFLPIFMRFVHAGSLEDMHQLVQEHPELVGQEAAHLLSRLVDAAKMNGDEAACRRFSACLALVQRCHEVGVSQAFEEAERGPGKPMDLEEALQFSLDRMREAGAPEQEQLHLREQIATALIVRYDVSKDQEDLDAAIRCWEELVSVARAAFLLTPTYCNNLGSALTTRYALVKDEADLRRAIEAHRSAIDLSEPGSDLLPGLMTNLGNALMDRHALLEDLGDLDEAVATFEKAVELSERMGSMDARINRAGLLANLAEGLGKRFALSARASDLDAVIDVLRRAVSVAMQPFPDVAELQNNLGAYLVTRFEKRGEVIDLDEARELFESTIPHLSARPEMLSGHLVNYGNAWRRRYQHDRDPSSLEHAIDAYRQAVDATQGSLKLIGRLANLANALFDRYKSSPSKLHADEAISIYEEAIEASPAGHRLLPELLNSLGNTLPCRYRHAGRIEDLTAAVDAQERALEELSLDSPERPSHMSSLGNRYLDLYQHDGKITGLKLAVDWHQFAVNATPEGSPELPKHLANLGVSLRARYSLLGQKDDLSRAIQAQAQATMISEDAEQLPGQLANWGAALADRYEQVGDLNDLDAAIASFRRALGGSGIAQGADGDVLRTGLGHALRSRFRNTRQAADLREAIGLYEELSETVPRSPARAPILSSLASALDERYQRGADPSDATRAIGLHRQARDLTPAESPSRPIFLSNLATSLLLRYEGSEGKDRVEDLDEAIVLLEEAVKRMPESSPLTPGLRANLATGLCLRHTAAPTNADLIAASTEYEKSCRAGVSISPRTVLIAATRWGEWASARGAWKEAASAYEYGLEAAESLVGVQSSRRQKETWLRLTKGLGSRAAYAHAKKAASAPAEGEALQEAVMAYERSRAVLLAEALEQRAGRTVAGVTWDTIVGGAERAPLVYIVAATTGGVILVVTPDGVVRHKFVSTLSSDSLREEALLFVRGYAGLKEGEPAEWQAALDEVGTWLWDHVMAHVLAMTGSAEEVVLVPGGYLGFLPLHAAWTADESAIGGQRYALDQVRISYASNARAAIAARQMSVAVPDSILVVEDPYPVHSGSLRHSDLEASAVMRAFVESQPLRCDSPAVWRRKAEATREAVKGQLNAHSVLHFCCHGLAEPVDPLSGGLLLAHDEVLSVRDVMERRSAEARLAVLSACETSMPGPDLPDEMMSLPTSLIEAGVAGVIGSLWLVENLSGALLMIRFYELWRMEKLEPCEALRRAQQWVRDQTNAQLKDRVPDELQFEMAPATDRPFSHPMYWAAFTFTGV